MLIYRNIKWIISCFILACSILRADTNVLFFTDRQTAGESFNSFEGSFKTLPSWIFISTNGTHIVNQLDTNVFCGISTGNVQTGGCYAWNLGNGERAIGWQPTDLCFTPGYIAGILQNAGSNTAKEINIAFEIVFKNNGSSNRSSYVSLQWSADGTNFSQFPGMYFETPGQKTPNAVWERKVLGGRFILNPPIQPGERLWLRWWSDDAGGIGTRDELGIRNFMLKVYLPRGTTIDIK
jgi:hypothetical protein